MQYIDTSTPGMVTYIKTNVCLLGTEILNDDAFKATILSFYHKKFPIVIQYVGIYISPKSKYNNVIQKLQKIISSLDFRDIIIIMGDFNMKSILNGKDNYNDTLIKHMKDKYNFKQYIIQNTTSRQSQLDLCFGNIYI